MELYYMLSILDVEKEETLRAICAERQISVVLTNLGRGTATQSQLSLYQLDPTEKAILGAIVTAPTMRRMLRAAKHKMFMDVPGNGIMLFIPVKSVGGRCTLEEITKGQNIEGTTPIMDFKNELIVVILNEGHTDAVMDAARSQGATGGTVMHAKGTGRSGNEKFFEVSVAEEKDMIYILAASESKAAIMRAIARECGAGTKAGAVCFSLPVSATVGFKKVSEDAESF